MGKFRPLPEPIRLQDLLNSARSRTEKKIKGKNAVFLALVLLFLYILNQSGLFSQVVINYYSCILMPIVLYYSTLVRYQLV